MKTTAICTMLFSLLLGAASAQAAAGAFSLSYGGRLANAGDEAEKGPVDLEIGFYPGAKSTSAMTLIPKSGVALDDGVFQVDLDMTATERSSIFGDGSTQVWVEVVDKTHGKTYPRQMLSAVPYAIAAQTVPVDGTTVVFDAAGRLKANFTSPTGGVTLGMLATTDTNCSIAGKILKSTGAAWTCAADDSAATGTAGGDLLGSYPNPTLAASGVSAGTYPKVTVDTKGRVTSGFALVAGDIPGLAGSAITSGTVAAAHLPAMTGATGVAAGFAGLVPTPAAADGVKFLKGNGTWAAIQGPDQAPSGSSAAPAFAFSADSNTGMYNAAADSLAFSTGATERLRIDSSGKVGIGTLTPSSLLELTAPDNVAANYSLKITGTLFQSLSVNNQGNVGIGAIPSGNTLTVGGPIFMSSVGSNLAFENFSGTGRGLVGAVNGSGNTWAIGTSDGGSINYANTAMVWKSNGDIGIGVTTPAARLDVLAPGTGANHALRIRNGTPADILSLTESGKLSVKNLHTAGAMSMGTTNVTSSATMAATDNYVTIAASSANITYTLEPASAYPGRQVMIKRTDATVKIVTLNATGQGLIDASMSTFDLAPNGSVTLVSNGTTWLLQSKILPGLPYVVGGCDAAGPWGGANAPAGCSTSGICTDSGATPPAYTAPVCVGGATFRGHMIALPGYFGSGCSANWGGTGTFSVKYTYTGVCVK